MAGEENPEHDALLADSVGLALLVVLKTLAPAERVAFVLHDMLICRSKRLGRSSAARLWRRGNSQAVHVAGYREGRSIPTTIWPDSGEVAAAFLAARATAILLGCWGFWIPKSYSAPIARPSKWVARPKFEAERPLPRLSRAALGRRGWPLSMEPWAWPLSCRAGCDPVGAHDRRWQDRRDRRDRRPGARCTARCSNPHELSVPTLCEPRLQQRSRRWYLKIPSRPLCGPYARRQTRWLTRAFAACVKGRTPFTPLWVLVIATSWQKPERCSLSHERKMLTSAHAPESVS